MPTPLDLYSTEDHDYHLLDDEAVPEEVFTLRPGTPPVKSENGTKQTQPFPVGMRSSVTLQMSGRNDGTPRPLDCASASSSVSHTCS